MKKLLSFSIVLFSAGLITAVELPKCTQAPLIDGVEDAVWSEAAEFPLFSNTGQPLVMETVARLMYDDHNLYAFVHCREVNLVEARQQERFERHDAALWDNDCIEFFFDTRDDGRAYYQFIVDVHGSAADLLHNDPDGPQKALDWNGYWRHAAGEYLDGWTVEVAIPWRTLKVAPGTVERLGFNVSRARRISPFERGTLAAGTQSISKLAYFPVLEGMRIAMPDVSGAIQPGAVFLGKNRLCLRVQNHTASEMSGQLELVGITEASAELLRQTAPLTLAPGETRDLALDYNIETPGLVQVSVNFLRGEEALFLDLADYVFRQPLELNDTQPLVLAGDEHPVYVRLFTAALEGWTLEITVHDAQEAVCASATNDNLAAAGFILLPTARLAPGNYTVKLKLQQASALDSHQYEVPLTVIRRL